MLLLLIRAFSMIVRGRGRVDLSLVGDTSSYAYMSAYVERRSKIYSLHGNTGDDYDLNNKLPVFNMIFNWCAMISDEKL